MVFREKLVTVDEFERFIARPENVNRRFELIAGEIIEKMPTQLHAAIVYLISGYIFIYLQQNPLARGMVEARYQMQEDKHNSVLPDLSFITDMKRRLIEKGSAPYMPDLAVKVKSPDDSFTKLRQKAEYYLANGTRIVWLGHPQKRLVEVYVPGADVEILTEVDTLSGGDVLPGFTLPVRNIFPD